MNSHTIPRTNVSLVRIFQTWWPLAASWVLMSVELPALSAVVARLDNPDINLAAYGGIVFPLALIVESPIIMLLAASTALSKDSASYQLVWRFMMVASAILTSLHLLVAFTPLYYVVVERIIGAPQEIIEPARIGLMIMTPWTWSIAYRRFNQGVLIRFGHSHLITLGTVVRLFADLLVLLIGYSIGSIPGIVVATSAVIAGVISEAVYIGIVVRPVRSNELRQAPAIQPALTWRGFFTFYIPLAMTSLLFLLSQPIGSAAMSRLPQSIPSLAVWPVLGGFLFILRSMGVAFNEVVVALLDESHSFQNLRRFTIILATGTTILIVVLAVTPLSTWWFHDLMGLSDELTSLSKSAIWLALPIPAVNVLLSWFQGAIVHGRRTGGVTEATIAYLITSGIVLTVGVLWNAVAGIYIAIAALSISMSVQTAWLWFRSRPVFQQIKLTDAESPAIIAAHAETG